MARKTKQDPTGQATNRRRGTRSLNARLVASEKQIKALVRQIPKSMRRKTKISNYEQTTVYDYEISDIEEVQLEQAIVYVINDELLETQTNEMPIDWYWKKHVERPYRQGTVEEIRDFNVLIVGAIAAGVLVRGLPPTKIDDMSVLFSDIYRKSLSKYQFSNFSIIKSLSQRTASQVMQVIRDGFRSGHSPTAITGVITDRFNVSRSSAKRIANTEINRAYNDSKLNATSILSDQSGLRAGVIHISALLPTTRPWHASRHGKAYTVEDQQIWWDSDSNRINCHCTTKAVLIDRRGNVIQKDLQENIIKEGEEFFKSESE